MSIAPKPASADFAAAGAAPLAAIAAMTAIDGLDLSAGETVLIIGATGGVGSFAVQLAATAGATVITPALAENTEYLRSLVAVELPDRDADIVATVREAHPEGVDALLDLVSFVPGAFDEILGKRARVSSTNGAAGGSGPAQT